MFLSKATDMSNSLAGVVQDLRHQADPLLNRVNAAAVGAALAALASLASRSHDRH